MKGRASLWSLGEKKKKKERKKERKKDLGRKRKEVFLFFFL